MGGFIIGLMFSKIERYRHWKLAQVLSLNLLSTTGLPCTGGVSKLAGSQSIGCQPIGQREEGVCTRSIVAQEARSTQHADIHHAQDGWAGTITDCETRVRGDDLLLPDENCWLISEYRSCYGPSVAFVQCIFQPAKFTRAGDGPEASTPHPAKQEPQPIEFSPRHFLSSKHYNMLEKPYYQLANKLYNHRYLSFVGRKTHDHKLPSTKEDIKPTSNVTAVTPSTAKQQPNNNIPESKSRRKISN